MAKKKVYAVANGRKTGLFDTWDKCKEQVDKFAGAKYKSFTSTDDAIAYLKEYGVYVKADIAPKKEEKKTETLKPIKSKANIKSYKEYIEPEEFMETHDYICFVDGSYNKEFKVYGSGVAVLSQLEPSDIVPIPLIDAGYDKWDQWNIVGELEATKLAIKNALAVSADKVVIYHDLANIALWATGEFRAKNEYTQDYVRFIEEYSKELDITFVKVKGHSGNKYNDYADSFADRAVKGFLEKYCK